MTSKLAPYELRISRLTIDKLGVKLYDKVSAVVAELLANSYDADAENATVRLPLNTVLRHKNSDDDDEGTYSIEVVDDGHGMTPEEARQQFLNVGRDRRRAMKNGHLSRSKKRPVMGRKGIGKLAPFGICRKMEIISSGGSRKPAGYLTSHFFLDYDELLQDIDTNVPIEAGELDGTFRREHGTTIRLTTFLPKRVPDADTFYRQLATRFVFARPDFAITVEDTRDADTNPPRRIRHMDVPVFPETRIDVSKRSLKTEDGELLPVKGWLAMAKDPFKNEELAGVRIYARNKIVAMTRDFEQPSGFTGEFTIRSYLVGEIFAEWLDKDDGEDLIRSDRQGILWDSDYGRALKQWGADLIKEIGTNSRGARRERVRNEFLTVSEIAEKASKRYQDPEVAEAAVEIAKQIGAFAAEDELGDVEYVDGMTSFILSVAPHKALIEAFQKFAAEIAGGEAPQFSEMLDLFGKTRVAEAASYAQIARERIWAIEQLESLSLRTTPEKELQSLIARAPWLVEPSWSVLTKNQTLKTFKAAFESYFRSKTGESVLLAIDAETKRPDFTLISLGHRLYIVEIKQPLYLIGDDDAERLMNYVVSFGSFFKRNRELEKEFPDGFQILLIADGTNLKKASNQVAFKGAVKSGQLKIDSWTDFLQRAKKAHEDFLKVRDAAAKRRNS